MKLRTSVALIEVGASICFAEFQDFAGMDEFHSFKPGFCGIILGIVAKGCFLGSTSNHLISSTKTKGI